jgi:FkbM family methyltransferase
VKSVSIEKKALKSASTYFALFGLPGLARRAWIIAARRHNLFYASIPRSGRKIIIRLGTTDVAAFEHVFINDEYGFSLARAPATIVDLGANIGASAAYFALRYPTARIFAVEPEPSNFEILSKNAKLFPQVVPIHAAVWNREGRVEVRNTGEGHWSMRATEADTPDRGPIRATTLQTLMQEYRIMDIDLLKVDVEGAECEIFQDASAWIDRVAVICTELHDRFRPGCSAVYRAATKEFPVRWRRGELDCVARDGLIADK